MNASVTFRLPRLAVPEDSEQTARVLDTRPSAEPTSTDEELMLQVVEGSREALAVLFRRYARIVRGVAFRVLRDPCEADDLLQDIFLLIHRKCGMFDASRGPARFWILQMTHHRAISRRRYLTSRHFYSRLDLDQAAGRLLGSLPESAPRAGSIDEALEKKAFVKVLNWLGTDPRDSQ